MINKDNLVSQINHIAEFKNKNLEKVFFTQYINNARKNIGIVAVLTGIIFLLLIFFDFFIYKEFSCPFLYNISIRIFIFLLSLILLWISQKVKSPNIIINTFFIYEIIFVLSYQIMIILVPKDPIFMDQAMAFLLILFASFLIPGRWIYCLLFSLGIMAEFLIAAPKYINHIPFHQYIGVFIYFLIAILFAAIYSFNINVYKRMQYLRENQLEQLAVTDPLTNIYNRQKFDRAFVQWLNIAKTEETVFAIIMFDLDNFKVLNDTLGHMTGDKVLIECVNVVSVHLRSRDVFARWGGEEFMILLPHTGLEEAAIIAERLRQTIEKSFSTYKPKITASFGVTQYKKDDTTDTIIMRVDSNLYIAKKQGKNCIYFN